MNVIDFIGIIFFFAVAFVVLYVNKRLKDLKLQEPSLIAGAGIERIDWWWKCIAGIFRLGFLSSDLRLRAFDKVMFRCVIVIYFIMAALALYNLYNLV